MLGLFLSAVLTMILTITPGCAGSGWIGREGFIAPDGIYVVHVPGIMGTMAHDQAFGAWLILSGVQEVKMFDWTGPMALVNLADTRRHERTAHELVRQLHLLRAQHPSARIVVTSHSGGTRIALRAAELLAEQQAETGDPPLIEQLWIIAAAVSPAYDLTEALSGAGHTYVVDSDRDWFILGLGTSIFGTADRSHEVSAGMVGFRYEDGDRLTKIHYDPWWRQLHNTGDHLSALGRDFVQGVIAPIMLGEQPTWTDGLSLRQAGLDVASTTGPGQ